MTASTEDTFTYPTRFPVLIGSNAFRGNLVRMAGDPNPQPQPYGFGTVNCQANQHDIDKNPFEVFDVIRNGDGTVSFESHAFPSNYLRMEGVTNPQWQADGFGTVNCQASIGPWEQFVVSVLTENTEGVLVSIESNAFPNNYLHLSGENPPKPADYGFGTVKCQASVGPNEQFHLGSVLVGSIKELVDWYYPNNPPTQAQIEQIVADIITAKPISDVQSLAGAGLVSFMALTKEEQAKIDAIDLTKASPCQIAIATLCIDVLLFLMFLMGIKIMRSNQMVRAALASFCDNPQTLDGISRIAIAIAETESTPVRATLLFNLLSQFLTGSGLKGVLKSLVSGLSPLGAAITAIAAFAQMTAWIATDGVLLVAQIVLGAAYLTTIIADAVAVKEACA